jgi:hypothetical protein
MKHTPGPWRVAYIPEVDADEIIQTGARSYAMNGGYTGKDEYDREMGVYTIIDDEPETIAQPWDEADALLIAAAPELLEALKATRGWWIHSIHAPKCLAAIAKADGNDEVRP